MRNLYCLYDKKLKIANDPFVASDLAEVKKMIYNFVLDQASELGVHFVKKLIVDLCIVFCGEFDPNTSMIFDNRDCDDYDLSVHSVSLDFLKVVEDRFVFDEMPMILKEEDSVNEEIS